MTEWLLRRFVKDYTQTADSRVRARIGALSGAVGIGCNALLFLVKAATGFLTGSVAVTADALNNLSDASGSIVTLVGFRLADKPADERHPYGHARAEYLSGLAVAVLILVIGLELMKTSAQKIFHPTPVSFSPAALGVLALSIGLKLWLSLFNRRLGRAIDSTALLAAAADSRNDCVATAGVLLSAVVQICFQAPVDGYMGLAVALFILRSGWAMARETVSPLLGENAGPELRQRIVDYVQQQPKVLGYHDLMVHDYGPGQRFASLHVEMDYREDPLECHEIIDDLERECLRSHNVHLVIHYDPVVTDDPALTALKEQVSALLRREDPRLTLHDFRMVQGRRHMNLVFDVALPGDLRGREEAIRQGVEQALNQSSEGIYHVKITFDTADFNGG